MSKTKASAFKRRLSGIKAPTIFAQVYCFIDQSFADYFISCIMIVFQKDPA